MSHVSEYLGRVGVDSKTPSINLLTKGWLPRLLQPSIRMQVDKAHLVVLIVLYPTPVWYNSTGKFTPVSAGDEKGSIFLLLQYCFHLLM